ARTKRSGCSTVSRRAQQRRTVTSFARSSAFHDDGRFLPLSRCSRDATPCPGSSRRRRPAAGADGNRARRFGPGRGPPFRRRSRVMESGAAGVIPLGRAGMQERMVTSPPRAPSFIIKRPRLTTLLDQATARIILLLAPAGYG